MFVAALLEDGPWEGWHDDGGEGRGEPTTPRRGRPRGLTSLPYYTPEGFFSR